MPLANVTTEGEYRYMVVMEVVRHFDYLTRIGCIHISLRAAVDTNKIVIRGC